MTNSLHGRLFDQMFEGIRQILNTSLIHAINVAEQNLKNPVAIKLLKILLLVKYVRVFKATHEHLKILLIRELGSGSEGTLDARIAEALNLLEYQTYIQRNGTVYEYLTNEEKDVENEIKRVEVGHGRPAEIYKRDRFFRDSEVYHIQNSGRRDSGGFRVLPNH